MSKKAKRKAKRKNQPRGKMLRSTTIQIPRRLREFFEDEARSRGWSLARIIVVFMEDTLD